MDRSGLGAGLIANLLIPGKRSQGLILTCLIGVAGALIGGWVASRLFHVHSLQGFFNLSTWLTAIAGAAVLLLAYHLVSGRSGHSHGPAGSRTAENCPGLLRLTGAAPDGRRHGSPAGGCHVFTVLRFNPPGGRHDHNPRAHHPGRRGDRRRGRVSATAAPGMRSPTHSRCSATT